jgi:hypothetical protein
MAAGHDVGPSVGPFFGLKFGFTWFLHRHSQGSGCGADSTLTLPTAAGPTFLCRDTARALVASREGETTKHFTYQRDTPFGVVSSVNGSFFARRSLLRSAGTLRGVWFTLSHDGIDRNKWTLLTRETANHRNCRFSTTTSTCGRLIIRNLSTHIFWLSTLFTSPPFNPLTDMPNPTFSRHRLHNILNSLTQTAITIYPPLHIVRNCDNPARSSIETHSRNFSVLSSPFSINVKHATTVPRGYRGHALAK